MIYLTRISDVKPGQFDETWAVVRSMKQPSSWIKQVPELSPSSALFRRYWNEWKPSGNWNRQTFETQYAPQFLHQLSHDQQAVDRLNQLYAMDKAGRRIALVCFCTDETLCHRSILAGILQGIHADARTPTGADYSYWWDAFLQARNT